MIQIELIVLKKVATDPNNGSICYEEIYERRKVWNKYFDNMFNGDAFCLRAEKDRRFANR